jgi:hypothetical protein
MPPRVRMVGVYAVLIAQSMSTPGGAAARQDRRQDAGQRGGDREHDQLAAGQGEGGDAGCRARRAPSSSRRTPHRQAEDRAEDGDDDCLPADHGAELAAGGPDRPQQPQLTDPLQDRQPRVFTMPNRAMMIARPSREWRPGARRAGPSLTATEPAAAGQRACGLSEVSDGKPLRVK